MMEKKPTGAPRGNQNARKHGFYSRVPNEAHTLRLVDARDVEGIDEEIAMYGDRLPRPLRRPRNDRIKGAPRNDVWVRGRLYSLRHCEPEGRGNLLVLKLPGITKGHHDGFPGKGHYPAVAVDLIRQVELFNEAIFS